MNMVDSHRKKAQEVYWYPNQCFCHVEFDLDNVNARHLSANPQCTQRSLLGQLIYIYIYIYLFL